MGDSAEDPPDDETERSSRRREQWERTERSSTTGNLRSETVAENTDVEEAINRAEAVEKHYRNSQPSKVRNVITEYRIKLTNIIAKLDRREVVKDFRDNTSQAYERERLIIKYLRSRGFSMTEIHKAIRRASPALFRKSQQIAYNYLKRLRDYTQQRARNLHRSAVENSTVKQSKSEPNSNRVKNNKKTRSR